MIIYLIMQKRKKKERNNCIYLFKTEFILKMLSAATFEQEESELITNFS